MCDFFNYEVTPDTPVLDPDARLLLERYSTLTKSEKQLLLAYLDGLQRINYSISEDTSDDQ